MAIAALALIVTGMPARSATVMERTITIELGPEGTLSERTHLAVRLDDPKDLAAWSPYPIFLDENRTLEALTAAVRRPDGEEVKVARRALDTAEIAGGGVLHSSGKVRTVTFPGVPVGSVLTLDYEVIERPYFTAGWVPLALDDPTEQLRVEVRGSAAGWRWRLDESGGARAGLAVEETPGRVQVTGAHVPRLSPPDYSPSAAGRGPVLRYAWGGAGNWQEIGRWFEGLLTTVPRAAAPVKAKAREIAASRPGKREQIAALLDFVRRDVRYVAVEVGIGGYRPHTPEEVLTKRWGDCKDKALLLVDLLAEVGIPAYPALVLAADSDRVDEDFPSPNQFNHMIAALPAEGLGLGMEGPTAGGYLFLDATQTTGGLDWLQPAVQDQDALVVRPDGAVLVHTPVRPRLESHAMEVDAEVTATGDAIGEARLIVSGEQGAGLAELFATSQPHEKEAALRRIFTLLLPGVELDNLRWGAAEKTAAPSVSLVAHVRIPELLPPAPATDPTTGPAAGVPGTVHSGGSFQLPGFNGTPAPSVLDDRTLPVVLSPFADRFIWHLKLPATPCPAAEPTQTVANDLGSFRQSVEIADRELTIRRETTLARRWIDPTAFPALKELSLAEHRALKKRIRLDCGS